MENQEILEKAMKEIYKENEGKGHEEIDALMIELFDSREKVKSYGSVFLSAYLNTFFDARSDEIVQSRMNVIMALVKEEKVKGNELKEAFRRQFAQYYTINGDFPKLLKQLSTILYELDLEGIYKFKDIEIRFKNDVDDDEDEFEEESYFY